MLNGQRKAKQIEKVARFNVTQQHLHAALHQTDDAEAIARNQHVLNVVDGDFAVAQVAIVEYAAEGRRRDLLNLRSYCVARRCDTERLMLIAVALLVRLVRRAERCREERAEVARTCR